MGDNYLEVLSKVQDDVDVMTIVHVRHDEDILWLDPAGLQKPMGADLMLLLYLDVTLVDDEDRHACDDQDGQERY